MEKYWTLFCSISLIILLLQIPFVLIILSRIFKGARRYPPITPEKSIPDILGSVSVVVPTLNEAQRITPLLSGLTRQSYEVREIIVVDSNSQDGTPDLVKAQQFKDPRFRLINDHPLPPNWVGRPWALHSGFGHTSSASDWFLGLDADTQPRDGLVAGLVKVANSQEYDLVSLSPQFILKYPLECLLQPALLITLLYRFESAGIDSNSPERVMANGQCFLCRRSVLNHVNGYTSAKSSFCDDVTLARNIATSGFKVGFLDGAKVLKVRMYDGAVETWKEWGRSLDLKDATNPAQTWGDILLLSVTQALPLLIVVVYLVFKPTLYLGTSPPIILLGLNIFLLVTRWLMLFAIAPSYDLTQAKGRWLFWLSPLADPLAVIRIWLSALTKPKEWRGRKY
ncbi:MAG: 2'-O-glycosyltransferase CruG [Cyanobacteria bacterium P01_A01_bin.84]